MSCVIWDTFRPAFAGVCPALQTQQFFEPTFGLADQGTLYHPLQFAVVAYAYADVFRLARLPTAVRVVLPLLAFVGKTLGYRAYDERFRAAPVVYNEAAYGSECLFEKGSARGLQLQTPGKTGSERRSLFFFEEHYGAGSSADRR